MERRLREIFERLLDHFGPLHWWPAETPFEVVIGAFLTQNTAWRNVEVAIDALRQAGALSPEGLAELSTEELQQCIRPAGYFRQKAERLHGFVSYLHAEHCGNLQRLLSGPLEETRRKLLSLKGIGPETADSILLYAGNYPSFVVDAYTRRLFARLGILQGDEDYETIRRLFMEQLPHDVDLYNEYHALIVEECKTFCLKRKPLCVPCPLNSICPTASSFGLT